MLNVAVVGEHSYVGTKFKELYGDKINITLMSSRGNIDVLGFKGYDSVIMAAAIVHRKQTTADRSLYFSVNRDLTQKIAEKAKREGVKHFVYISTMSVYGLNKGVITPNTSVHPDFNNYYSVSKKDGERAAASQADNNFILAILRPPMIYGEGAKGNYQRLVDLMQKLPMFPDYKNERSMISIENLSHFLANICLNKWGGVFHPQDPEYMCTTNLALQIAKKSGKKLGLTKMMNGAIKAGGAFSPDVSKMFGDLTYRRDIDDEITAMNMGAFGFVDIDEPEPVEEEPVVAQEVKQPEAAKPQPAAETTLESPFPEIPVVSQPAVAAAAPTSSVLPQADDVTVTVTAFEPKFVSKEAPKEEASKGIDFKDYFSRF
ncbi:MAG: NAD-dependent epimerase/dehydratase family protein [Oscillospiraceae bacterium]|jgi:UDP-glucose 4-epimerase|nr:NAD-dependent epimerase/dehydratase family protein [Oscillospiraceae bacterium]